jgi:hypothetical protein
VKSASGKLVIIGILGVALAAAGVSWWFRYKGTHRAIEFWGPEAAILIRDAPKVTLFRMPSPDVMRLTLYDPVRASLDDSARDISQARGLVHLRHALLEDRNFGSPAASEQRPVINNNTGYWLLSFYDRKTQKTAIVLFSEDCRHATRQKLRLMAYELTSISTEPIAAGLREMFAELSAQQLQSPR